MLMKCRINGLVALTIALATIVPTVATAASPRITHTVVSEEFSKQSIDARHVLEWVTQNVRPAFAPLGYGTVHVEHSVISVGRASASYNDSIPGKLPTEGVPGEIYRVENILPDGSVQSWEFTWVAPSSGHGGGWSVTGYTYKKGSDPVEQQ